MRTSFSDGEDRQLVALALRYQQQRQRIAWTAVALAMRRSKRSPRELEMRLKVLKRTYGRDLARFPSSLRSQLQPAPAPELEPAPAPAPEPLALAVVERTLAAIFASVTPRDVLQCAGAPHLNVGELLPLAIDAMLRVVDATAADVFVDVGSGVGNVVAQVALQTRVRKSIGIEIRRELCARARQLVHSCAVADERQLRTRVTFVCGDAVRVCVATRRPMNECTVVYLNNVLFQAETNAHLSAELCALPRARLVVSTAPFCARHRSSCRSAFCRAWELADVDHVPASWTADLVCIYFYQRRPRSTDAVASCITSACRDKTTSQDKQASLTRQTRQANKSNK